MPNSTTNKQGEAAGEAEGHKSTVAGARDAVGEALHVAKEKIGTTFEAAAGRASSAYAVARERTGDATRRTADGIEENPVVALIGGLALGALVGSLLPRSQREEEALASVGARLRSTATEAARAAREAGREKLGEIGLTRDSAAEKVSSLVDGALAAAKSAGGAAAGAVRETDRS